jgi:uncharacterized coiled-coil protein SlyX
MSSELEERIRILEENHEYQDRTVEALNQVIIQQQAQLDKFEAELLLLKEDAMASSIETKDVNEPPPHY